MEKDNQDWCLNLLVTQLGRQMEYKQELINALASYGVKANRNLTISQLEKQLQLKQGQSHGKK